MTNLENDISDVELQDFLQNFDLFLEEMSEELTELTQEANGRGKAERMRQLVVDLALQVGRFEKLYSQWHKQRKSLQENHPMLTLIGSVQNKIEQLKFKIQKIRMPKLH